MIETNLTYNQRQYQRMIEVIDAYLARQISLRKLIDTLDALLGCLENVPREWYEDFMSQWSILEEIYAVALEKNAGHLENEDINLIKAAIIEVKKMTKDNLEEKAKIFV